MTALTAETAAATRLGGDAPCHDCGGDNIVWFTDNTFWNEVCRRDSTAGCPILCVYCFVRRVEALGIRPTGWRLLPEFPWVGARP